MKYRKATRTIEIGKLSLKLETVADLDEAIDELCKDVEGEAAEKKALELAPYYGVIWPSALALAKHIEKMGGWLAGKTVLEVGCGIGLPSIVAAKLGAGVTATDFHPDVPDFFTANTKTNDVEIAFQALDWRKDGEKLGVFDFVIGSDILYERTHPRDVARALASHCHKESHVLLADPGRSYLQEFEKELKSLGFRGDMFVAEADVFVLSFQKL